MSSDFRVNGLQHLLSSTLNSLSGLAHAWRHEASFRQEVCILPLLCLALFLDERDSGDCLLVLGGWLMVMAVELLNSGIEESLDLITREWNPHVKAGKDMASAAIFLTLAVNLGIWIHVFS